MQSLSVTADKTGLASNSRFATSTSNTDLPSPTKIFVSASGRVTGTVMASSGSALAGATVTFSGGDLRFTTSVTTDGSGFFDSGPIGTGSFNVSVSAAGHSTADTSASVSAGSSVNLDVTMQ
jgi:hypothetical protein